MKYLLYFITSVFFCLVSFIFGFCVVKTYAEDVEIESSIYEANIDEIGQYSTFIASPETTYVGYSIILNVTIKNAKGDGLEGHTVKIIAPSGCIVSASNGITDSSGLYSTTVVCSTSGIKTFVAYDITYADIELLIDMQPSVVVEDIPAPTLSNLDEYISDTFITATWDAEWVCNEFWAEIAEDENFTSIVDNIGWASDYNWYVDKLQYKKTYYVRVKCRSVHEYESGWSNIVSTTIVPPGVSVNIKSVDFDDSFKTFRVCINGINWDFIDSAELWVQKDDGEWIYIKPVDLENRCYQIQVLDISSAASNEWYGHYVFQVQYVQVGEDTVQNDFYAYDVNNNLVGNVTNIISSINSRIESVAKAVLEEYFDGDVGKMSSFVVVSTVLSGIGIAFFAGVLIGDIPALMLSAILELLGFLGIIVRGTRSGIVYNSISKEPIPRAIVRVFDKGGRLLTTAVTNVRGIFNIPDFKNKQVRFVVSKIGYKYPSNIVIGNVDMPYKNIYHGKLIRIKEQNDVNVSIPIDPVNYHGMRKVWRRFITSVYGIVSGLSLLFIIVAIVWSILLLYIIVNIGTVLLLVINITMLIFRILNARSLYANVWGYVVNVVTHKKEDRVILELIGTEFRQLVAKRVTYDGGKYYFIVGPGKYLLRLGISGAKIVNSNSKDGILIHNKKKYEIRYAKKINLKYVT